ncbi:MAG: protein kinase [Planctomycetota bacterium]
MDDTTATGDEDELEELVARCLEASKEGGAEAVERICAEHPERAEALRARLASLARVGLLDEALLDALDAFAAGPRVPGYRLGERLGAGGMAVVHAAQEERSGETVALKTADPRLPWNERMRERFRREIEAARRVSHPHVVAIRDVGEAGGLPYYTMDFVPGATLGGILDALRQGGLPAGELTAADLRRAWASRRVGEGEPAREWGRTYLEIVCRIALETAEALEHVHANGIVHRDVKPSNVLVDPLGRGRLFDLGLAHLVDDTRLTRTGDFAGSPKYAAPEQVAGRPEDIDARTDVYGLGATLFELIALRPPIEGKNTPDLLRRIQHEEAPPLRKVAPWAPRELETICQCCLEKDSDQRYASARDLAQDLERFLEFRPVRARPVGAVRRAVRFARRKPAATLAGALIGLILIAAPLALVFYNLSIAGQRDRANAAALEARREAAENREVSQFLEGLILRLDDSGDPAHREAARGLIDEARVRLDAEADIRPLTRAGLFHTVARVLAGMGQSIDAIPLLDRSLSFRARELGEGHPETAAVIQELAALHLQLGNREGARGLAERGLRALEAAGEDPGGAGRPAAMGRETLGRIALAEGDHEAARALLEEAAALYRTIEGDPSIGAARVLRELGRLHHDLGELELAEQRLTMSVEVESAAWEPGRGGIAEGMQLLAAVHESRGETARAAARLSETLDLIRKRGHGTALEEMGQVLARLVPLQEQRLARGERGVGAELFEQYVLLGENREGRGADGAAQAFGRALELAEGLDQADPDLRGRAHVGLARTRWAAGFVSEAQREVDAALAIVANNDATELWVAGLFETALRLAHEVGDSERVEEGALRAQAWFLARLEHAVVPDRRLVALLRSHALLLFELERALEAEPLLRGADGLERRLGAPRESVLGLVDSLRRGVFDRTMQDGISHLQWHDYEAAVAAFEACRTLRPDDPIASYNLACAFAQLGRSGDALEALGRAVELGYAYRERAAELTSADPDLAPLREDPRFELVLGRIRSLSEAAALYTAQPEVYVPDGVDPEGRVPLLVVLHENGETKRTTVEGPWREVADALGFVLLAPSGRIPSGAEPEEGMLWTDSLKRYVTRTWYYEKPVRDAISEYRRLHDVDPERVFLAGEGLGGTLAFNIAVHAPELYRGCLLLDAAVAIELAQDVAPNLDSLGVRIAIVADPTWRPAGMPEGTTTPEYLAQTFRQLGAWGLDVTLGTRAGRAPSETAPRLIEAVRFLDTGRSEPR